MPVLFLHFGFHRYGIMVEYIRDGSVYVSFPVDIAGRLLRGPIEQNAMTISQDDTRTVRCRGRVHGSDESPFRMHHIVSSLCFHLFLFLQKRFSEKVCIILKMIVA